MKKFLAVLVMLSLVVGSVFAQASFGGYGRGRLDLVTIKNGATEMRGGALVTDKTIKGPLTDAWIEYSFNAGYTNEEGTAGGNISVTGNQNGFAAPWNGAYIPWRVRAWWQPISQIRVNLGWTDWAFGTDDFVGWGYNATAGDIGVAPANGLFGAPGDVFLGGTGYHGLTLGITPMDMLAINFGLNFMGDDMQARTDLVRVFKTFFAQVNLKLDGIGTFSLSYQGGPGTLSTPVTAYNAAVSGADMGGIPIYNGTGDVVTTSSGEGIKTYTGDTGTIAFRFSLSAIENLALNFGFNYRINGKLDQYTTRQYPIRIALGVQYNISDTFGVKTRMQFHFLGKDTNSQDSNYYIGTEDPFKFGIDITPYFKVAGMNINVNLGLALTKFMHTYPTGTPDAAKWNPMQISWMINPYVEKPLGNVSLFAGIIVQGTPSAYFLPPSATRYDQAKSKSVIEFRIPVGFNVNF